MSTITKVEFTPELPPRLPDHMQLPETDGKIVENFLEHPQSTLLSSSIWPVLERLHPDGQFAVGQDSGIYYQITQPPLDGCKAPDWFYVPGVPPTLDGQFRRSYVLWQEVVAPLIVIEFVSRDGSEERDRTPQTGKFWAYEQAIRAPYYAIYEVRLARVEVHHLVDGLYQLLPANERGHYGIEPMGVALGIWEGKYRNLDVPWLRWWDAQGQLLPTPEEVAEQERARADLLAARLRELGLDPDKS